MTITVTRVKADHMPPPAAGGPAGLVAATVEVDVPAINCRAVLSMTVPAPAGSTRADWADIAYDRALMMLDPA